MVDVIRTNPTPGPGVDPGLGDPGSATPPDPLYSYIESMVVDEVKSAKSYVDEVQATERTKRWDRYYGRPMGNEKRGRSKYISRDILETVEWILPNLLSTFVSTDPKIEISIQGQPPIVGKALMAKIQEDVDDDPERSLYILYYQWFKDALVSDTAFLCQSWVTESEYESIRIPHATAEQMQIISDAPDMQLQEFTDMGDGSFTDIDVQSESVTRDGLFLDNIPHWDMLVTKNTRYINDEYGKGYKSMVTLDYLTRVNQQMGDDFFRNLDRLQLSISKRLDESGERSSYMDGQGEDSGVPDPDAGSVNSTGFVRSAVLKQPVEVVQWYTRCDVNGDGMLENIRCWLADSTTLIRWELNDDDAILISALSPIIDCYKFFGISFSEIILDLQNLKTMLIRRILDNFDFSSLGRTFIRPGGRVPIRELLQNIPGDAIIIDPDRVRTEYAKPFDHSSLQLLEYVETIKENRTGNTRYNQGMDADSLNKTATGIINIQNASQKRIDMIVRIFAETGVKDNYYKCAKLYQRNLTSPFTVKVEGKEVTITPDMLRGRIRCKANLGVEAQVGVAEAQKVQSMFTFLTAINQIFPGIIGPQQIHNLAIKYVTNMGNKQPEDFVAILDEFIQSLTVSQQQMQQAKQLQMQLEQGKLAVEQAKLQLEAQRLGIDLKQVMLDFQARMQTSQANIEQRDRAGNQRMLVDLIGIMADQVSADRDAAIAKSQAVVKSSSSGSAASKSKSSSK